MSEERKATIYDFRRMCREGNNCENCPLNDEDFDYCCGDCLAYGDIDEANRRILRWCDEHDQPTENSPIKEDETQTIIDALRLFANFFEYQLGCIKYAELLGLIDEADDRHRRNIGRQ